jgi:hypothetical protein
LKICCSCSCGRAGTSHRVAACCASDNVNLQVRTQKAVGYWLFPTDEAFFRSCTPGTVTTPGTRNENLTAVLALAAVAAGEALQPLVPLAGSRISSRSRRTATPGHRRLGLSTRCSQWEEGLASSGRCGNHVGKFLPPMSPPPRSRRRRKRP